MLLPRVTYEEIITCSGCSRGTKIARPGFYMLFAVNNWGIPSIAKIIELRDYSLDVPTSATLSKGSYSATANVNQLYLNENTYLGTSISSTTSSTREVELTLDGTAKTSSTSKARFQIECSTTASATLAIDLYDYDHSSWVQVATYTTGTSDEAHSVEAPNNSTHRYVNSSTAAMKARLRWSDTSHSYSAKIDTAEFGIKY